MKRFATMVAVLMAHGALAQGALELALTDEARASLTKSIAAAKGSNPSAFASVAAVKRQVAVLDARKRGRFAPLTPALAAIPNGAWALADALAFSGAIEASLPSSAQIAWQSGLLEALGRAREPKTEPVLVAALQSAVPVEVLRSAAEGLGRLGTDSAARALIEEASKRTGREREAVLAGMGACRREAVGAFLLGQTASATNDAEKLALIKALSVLGNAWALATPAGATVKAEVPRLRALAAQGLVRLFSENGGNVRQQAADAVLVVDAPETNTLLAQVRAKDPAAIDALSARLTRR